MPRTRIASITIPSTDPNRSAKSAGLRYVSDLDPGIRRKRRGKGFLYFSEDGKVIRTAKTLGRIRALVIPPAWKEVWICAREDGHLQATGRDIRGRKQYRYHSRWSAVREENKFTRMIAFATVLPSIRRQVRRDLTQAKLSKTKVVALVVKLLESTLIRVGNEEYARTNRSYGLCTMRDPHAVVRGRTVTFEFRGKSGIQHSIRISEPKLARAVKRCQDLPGQELFQYLEDGKRKKIDSADVNAYLQEITGEEFTAKDFRTWAGTVLAALALAEYQKCDSQAESNRNIVAAIESVARRLGNTRAICRKCYVHPAVLDVYLEGGFHETVKQLADQTVKAPRGLSREEYAIVRLLQRRFKERRGLAYDKNACVNRTAAKST